MEEDYDASISRQSRRKLSQEELQRTRYGIEIDRRRALYKEAIGRYSKVITFAAGIAAAAATIWKAWVGS
jgi:hypothetical protein